MGQEKRFGKRVAEPSSVQIVHELKLMALRQSLDATVARDGTAPLPAGEARHPVRDGTAPSFPDSL